MQHTCRRSFRTPPLPPAETKQVSLSVRSSLQIAPVRLRPPEIREFHQVRSRKHYYYAYGYKRLRQRMQQMHHGLCQKFDFRLVEVRFTDVRHAQPLQLDRYLIVRLRSVQLYIHCLAVIRCTCPRMQLALCERFEEK